MTLEKIKPSCYNEQEKNEAGDFLKEIRVHKEDKT